MPGIPAREERGGSTAEYALLAGAIAALLVVTVVALGHHVYRVYDSSCDHAGQTTDRTSVDC